MRHQFKGRGRTNIRMPSASAFQSSTIFLSSSVAISIYIEKIGPEPSTKLDASFRARFCVAGGRRWPSSILADRVNENDRDRAG